MVQASQMIDANLWELFPWRERLEISFHFTNYNLRVIMMLRQFLRSQFWQFFTIAVCLTIVVSPVVIAPPASAGIVSGIIRWLTGQPAPQRPPAGSRNGEIVTFISPGGWQSKQDRLDKKKPLIWHLQPTIVYKKDLGDNAVSIMGTDKDLELSKPSTRQDSVYAQRKLVSPLQPGKQYMIYVEIGNAKAFDSFPLEVLPESERKKITAKLNQIDDKVAQQRLEARIKVFHEAGLWSDVLQELVENAKVKEDWQAIESIVNCWSNQNKPTLKPIKTMSSSVPKTYCTID
jgi:hypothetical protein